MKPNSNVPAASKPEVAKKAPSPTRGTRPDPVPTRTSKPVLTTGPRSVAAVVAPAVQPRRASANLLLLRDCEVQTFRAGGKGGQYQNKTESAVRLIHLPTGIAVVCRDERSQYMNKMRCLELLALKLRKRREKPKPRIATAVPRSEKIKRKTNKKRVGDKKLLRKRPDIGE